jgi:excisionase family DNA binding protein
MSLAQAALEASLLYPSSAHSDSRTLSLPDRIASIKHALKAEELAEILSVSKITIFKRAKAGKIPSFRIGSAVRFDPKSVADWLRRQ